MRFTTILSLSFRKLSALVGVSALLLTSGCILPKGYIDPSFRTATYRDVTPAAAPVHVRVENKFSMNGKEASRASELLAKKASRVIESTKVFQIDGQASDILSIHIDNYGDKSEAFAKGFATGFTFGLVGSHVVDRYKMTISYRYANNQVFENTYDHALHSTVGIKSAPEGMQPVSYADAFDQIVEDLLLRFLVDFEKWQKQQPAPIQSAGL